MFNKGAIHSISCFSFLIQYCDIYCVVFNHKKKIKFILLIYYLMFFLKIVFIWNEVIVYNNILFLCTC